MADSKFEQIFNSLPSVRIIPDNGKVLLGMTHTIDGKEVIEYYSQDGSVTTDIKDAHRFSSNLEASYLAQYFKVKSAEHATHLHYLVNEGAATAQFELPPLWFVVVALPSGPNMPNEYLHHEKSLTTSVLDNAAKFISPVEANAYRGVYANILQDEKRQLVVKLYDQEVASIKAVAQHQQEQASAVSVDANGAAPDEQYIIRFVDKERENDTEGETTCPHWVRYYCEASLARYMTAAEWFSNMNSAIATARLLVGAAPEGQALHDEDPAVMLKMQLLGILLETPSLSGAQLVFKEGMIIQVLKVVENNSSDEGWNWEAVYEEEYRWIFDEPAMEDDEEEESSDYAPEEPNS
jgi:hypothetical protein